MTFNAPFGRVFRPPFGPALASAAAASSWWLSGGISAVNCIAAYQPKGAADLAASYINLANPGTYNAAPGVAPTWDATDGWTSDGTQYLTTGITLTTAGTWSAICRFSDISNAGRLFGTYTTNRWYIAPKGASYVTWAIGKAEQSKTPNKTSGILCIGGIYGYRENGIAEVTGSDTNIAGNLFLMASSLYTSPVLIIAGKIQAMAFYNIAVSSAQVLALNTAMAAL
jgi:hypothetical protein